MTLDIAIKCQMPTWDPCRVFGRASKCWPDFARECDLQKRRRGHDTGLTSDIAQRLEEATDQLLSCTYPQLLDAYATTERAPKPARPVMRSDLHTIVSLSFSESLTLRSTRGTGVWYDQQTKAKAHSENYTTPPRNKLNMGKFPASLARRSKVSLPITHQWE